MQTINKTLSLLAFAALPALSGCGTGEASVADVDAIRQATPVPVEVSFPVRADIYATYNATTTIGSEGDAPVLARVPGEVVELLAEEGHLSIGWRRQPFLRHRVGRHAQVDADGQGGGRQQQHRHTLDAAFEQRQ